MKNSYLTAALLIIFLNTIRCTTDEIDLQSERRPVTLTEKDVKHDLLKWDSIRIHTSVDGRLATSNSYPRPVAGFPDYKVFTYWFGGPEGHLGVGWSPEGISWIGAQTTLAEQVQFFSTCYLPATNRIYMVYRRKNEIHTYIRSSSDGINWSSLISTQVPAHFGKAELTIIDGYLHAIWMTMEAGKIRLTIKKFLHNGYLNAWLYVVDGYLPYRTSSIINLDGKPAYAYFNGLHYIFKHLGYLAPGASSSDFELTTFKSTDLRNWETGGELTVRSSHGFIGDEVDATVFNEKIYLTNAAFYDDSFNHNDYAIYVYEGSRYFNSLNWVKKRIGSAEAGHGGVAITRDASKIILSYRGKETNYNYTSYSYNGVTWYEKKSVGSSYTWAKYNEIVSIPYE